MRRGAGLRAQSGTSLRAPMGRDAVQLPMDFLRILIAILLPPLGVFLQVVFVKHFCLNILLTLLGYIPGIIHAVYIIATVGPHNRRPVAT